MYASGVNRRIALFVGGLAVVSMGLTVGCSAKQSPAPTAPAQNSVDSKRPQVESGGKPSNAQKPAAPPVKAKPAPTAAPGDN